MPRLKCSCGHQWDESEDSASRADSLPCPNCGNNVATATAAVGTEDASTVMQPAGWQGIGGDRRLDQAPPVLPDFEILEEIGRGGMGIVYRARQLADGQTVAIKVIRKDRLLHEEAVRRFRREAQAAARLCHANIVTVFDFDRAGDTHYLVMEFVDGITLERHVEQTGPLTIPQACDFIRQAALGLQHAHEQALIHRDIKPSNLMVTPRPTPEIAPLTLGEGSEVRSASSSPSAYQVKLLDMGVARVLQLGGQSLVDSLSTLTQSGSVIGTADYVAPEQLEDPHGADIRADLYSLGCTFYFILTGQVPFPGGTLLSKLDKQRWQAPTSLVHLRGDIPPAVARVVEKLMAKKPAERFASPGALAETLEVMAKNNYEDPPLPRVEFKELRRMTGHAESVLCVAFAPDGKHVATGAKDGVLIYWNAETGQVATRLPKHPQEIRSVAFSPTGEHIASASGLSIRLHDVRGQEIRRFSGHTGPVKCLAFSPDGKRFLSAGDEKFIRLWEVSSGREIQRFHRQTIGFSTLAFVPHSNLFATGSKDQTVRLWDLKQGLETEQFNANAGAVLSISVSTDSKLLASAHFDTVIRVWNLATAKLIGQLDGHKQMVSAVAFTPDGKRLVSAGQDHTLRLWDLATLSELACATCHSAGINGLALSPDGTRVVTAGADRMVVLLTMPK